MREEKLGKNLGHIGSRPGPNQLEGHQKKRKKQIITAPDLFLKF